MVPPLSTAPWGAGEQFPGGQRGVPPHEAEGRPDHAAGSDTHCLGLSGTSDFTFLSLSDFICKRGFEFCPPGFYWVLKGPAPAGTPRPPVPTLQTPDSSCTPSWHAAWCWQHEFLGWEQCGCGPQAGRMETEAVAPGKAAVCRTALCVPLSSRPRSEGRFSLLCLAARAWRAPVSSLRAWFMVPSLPPVTDGVPDGRGQTPHGLGPFPFVPLSVCVDGME